MPDDEERRHRLREASFLHSSSREALIAHVFVAEVLQEAWFAREQRVDVLRSEVDAAGYDVVFECGAIVRHVQLKASDSEGKTSRQTINIRLADKPSGCVVWVVYRERVPDHRLDLTYLWSAAIPVNASQTSASSWAGIRVPRHPGLGPELCPAPASSQSYRLTNWWTDSLDRQPRPPSSHPSSTMDEDHSSGVRGHACVDLGVVAELPGPRT